MKKLALPITISAAFFFAACGDNIEEVTQVVQDRTTVVASEDDLPECTDENEGEQAFVKGESSARICVDGDWVAMAPGGSDVNFSCKTVELKDKSGLKIVCNGDSVGVVLNGTDGKDGEDGKDAVLPKDTAEADSERVAISLDSLVGVTQKGPFLKGSTVYLYELSDGRTLKQTNGNFTSNITRDDGRYKFTARDLVSQYAMVVVDGYYRNEVTGKTSDAPIRLKAITDMRKRNSVNVNILTQLEFDRVYHLVTRGDKDGKKLTVKQAKRQAQREIMSIFNITLDEDADAEDMDVFGSSEADAALLAISILLQGDRGESEMMALLSEISNDMADDGEWNAEKHADSIKAFIADWAFGQNLSKFRENVDGWGLGGEVGDFEKYINNFITKTLGLKACNGVKDATPQTVDNELSLFNGRSYQCFEKPDECDKCEMWVEVRPQTQYMNDTVNYGYMIDWRNRRMYYTLIIDDLTCDDKSPIYAYDGMWMAENLDLDYRVKGVSYGNRCYDDNCDTYNSFGHYYSWAAAMDSAGVYSVGGANCGANTTCGAGNEVRGICPEGWRLPNKDDWKALIDFIAYEYGDSVADLKLRSNTGWGCEFCLDGEDLYGFSMVPSGYCNLGGNCGGENLYLNLWTSTESNRDNAIALHMTNHDIEVESPNGKELDLRLTEGSTKSSLYPIRCVKISEVYPVTNEAKNCKKD